MKKVYAKLENHKGETLVELLASILICVISISLLMSGIAISVKINKNANLNDQSFYEILSSAERKQTPLPGTFKVVIEENLRIIEVPVYLYGGEGMYSYEISE